MTSRKQSAHARREAQRLQSITSQSDGVNNTNLNAYITTNDAVVSNIQNNLNNTTIESSNSKSFLTFQSDGSIATSWEARITDLENAPAGGGGGIDPSDPDQPIIIVDNFIRQPNGDPSGTGGLFLHPAGNTTILNTNNLPIFFAESETDHNGIIIVRLSAFDNLVNSFVLGQTTTADVCKFTDVNTLHYIIKTPATLEHSIRIGFMDDFGTSPSPNEIVFERLTGEANISVVTRSGGTQTKTSSGVAYSANTWYTFKIARTVTNTVDFTINGTSINQTTNIPTGFVNVGVQIQGNASNSADEDFKFDFFSLKLGDVAAVLPTGTTVVGTANEVEVTTVGSVITVGLPDSITVPTINTSQLNFNIAPLSPTNTIGGQYWDTIYNTVSLGLTANTNLKIGQDLYKYVRNMTGSLIPKGKVVYVNGHHAGTQLTIGLADASTEATSADVIGVTAENIADNTSGFVQTFGYLTGFATNTAEIPVGQEGKALYLSAATPGDMRIGLPTQPLHGVRIGFLVQRAGSGAMFINVQNYQELEELSDVEITSIANNDVLQWDNTDLRWENRSLATAGIAAASHTHPLSDLTNSSALPNQVPQWNGSNWVPVTLSTGGSPGGSTGQVQYNNAGAFAGATNVKINSNNLELVKPASEPTTAPVDSVVMYTKSIGQRDLPAFVDATGWATNLQTCIARNKYVQLNFNANTNTAPINFGLVYTTTTTGTAGTQGGAVAIGTASILAGSKRQHFTTSTTAGSTSGWRTSVANCWRGNNTGRGGFFCVWKFGIGDAVLTSSATLFIGLNDSTAVPATTVFQNPRTTTDATMRNQVGLVLADGSLVYQICHRNGTAAATSISTGITANLTDIIEFCLYTPPNGTTIYYYLKVYADSGSNTEISGDIGTSNIPANTTLFVPHMWRSNNLANVAVSVHALSFSIETPH